MKDPSVPEYKINAEPRTVITQEAQGNQTETIKVAAGLTPADCYDPGNLDSCPVLVEKITSIVRNPAGSEHVFWDVAASGCDQGRTCSLTYSMRHDYFNAKPKPGASAPTLGVYNSSANPASNLEKADNIALGKFTVDVTVNNSTLTIPYDTWVIGTRDRPNYYFADSDTRHSYSRSKNGGWNLRRSYLTNTRHWHTSFHKDESYYYQTVYNLSGTSEPGWVDNPGTYYIDHGLIWKIVPIADKGTSTNCDGDRDELACHSTAWSKEKKYRRGDTVGIESTTNVAKVWLIRDSVGEPGFTDHWQTVDIRRQPFNNRGIIYNSYYYERGVQGENYGYRDVDHEDAQVVATQSPTNLKIHSGGFTCTPGTGPSPDSEGQCKLKIKLTPPATKRHPFDTRDRKYPLNFRKDINSFYSVWSNYQYKVTTKNWLNGASEQAEWWSHHMIYPYIDSPVRVLGHHLPKEDGIYG